MQDTFINNLNINLKNLVWNDAYKLNIKPKPLQTVSQYAEESRYLSPEDSKAALMGDPKWAYTGFEYLRAFEDAFNAPLVRIITVMKSAQTGFTQAMINQMKWAVKFMPGPMGVLYPTEGNAIKFVKRKFDPMVRDNEDMRAIISDARKRDGNNSVSEKTFPGGFLSFLTSMAVNDLSQQSLMYLWLDDIDRIARTAGAEGDTIDLIKKRLQGFLEISKLVQISTPTITSTSRILSEYNQSNKQKFYVPCVHCGENQILKFAQLKGWYKGKGVYVPEETYYECEFCKKQLYEKDKYVMNKYGVWIAEKPEIISHAGFWISELYSTISTWQYVIEQFIPAKANPFKLQTFVNTVLGEVYDDFVEQISNNALMGRAEKYDASLLPEGVLLLTTGTDIHPDRAEITTVGFGLGEESWIIEHKIFYGNCELPYNEDEENNLYYRLEQYYETKFLHSSGMYLRIQANGIDTGFATTTVQKFIKKMNRKGKLHIYALQGDQGKGGAPVLNRGSINNKARVKQFSIGTYTVKNIIYTRLALTEYGPGYIHFPSTLDEEWYKQLTSEKLKPVYEKGIEVRKEWVTIRTRNEALDCTCYAYSGLDFLSVNLTAVHRNFNAKLERIKEEQKASSNQDQETSYENPVLSSQEQDADLRKYRHPKKKLKLTRQNNFATNY